MFFSITGGVNGTETSRSQSMLIAWSSSERDRSRREIRPPSCVKGHAPVTCHVTCHKVASRVIIRGNIIKIIFVLPVTPAPLCGTLFGLFYFFPVFRAFVPLAVFVIFQWYLVNPPVPDQIGWLNLTKSAVGKISDSYHSTSRHRPLSTGHSNAGALTARGHSR